MKPQLKARIPQHLVRQTVGMAAPGEKLSPQDQRERMHQMRMARIKQFREHPPWILSKHSESWQLGGLGWALLGLIVTASLFLAGSSHGD